MTINKFIEKLEKCLEELVTLNVVTVVGSPKVDIKTDGGKPSTQIALSGDNSKAIWTAIDLTQGDITTVVDPEFQGEAGRELREFHKNREAQGTEIIRGNISALKDL